MVKSKKEDGVYAEYKLIAELTKRGIAVNLPICNRYKYDMVCGNTALKRVQVKTLYLGQRGAYVLNNYHMNVAGKHKRKRVKYKNSEIDFLIGFVRETEDFYIIPKKIVKTKTICIWHNNKPKIGYYDWYSKYKNRFDLLV